jgi:hypothetical protein
MVSATLNVSIACLQSSQTRRGWNGQRVCCAPHHLEMPGSACASKLGAARLTIASGAFC